MINKLLKKLPRYLFFDTGDYRETIFLAGTGRSGTTWIQEIINYQNDYRILFEPFHSQKINSLKNWNYRQYLRKDNKDEKFLIPASRILSGKIKNPWIDQFNKKFYCDKRIVKDIRSQLILHWIKQQFPEIPIILLLRHPCAVASSKVKLGWETHLDDFLHQDNLMSDFLNPFQNELRNVTDSFDKHIFMWCVENFIPLKQFKSGEILVVYYENICINPEIEIKKILTFLGKNFSPKITAKIKKPSSMTTKDSAIFTKNNLINSWQKNITDKQINRTLEILGLFGMDKIYNHQDLPLLSDIDTLNLFSN